MAEKTITVNGRNVPWSDGMNVQTVLDVMNYTFRLLVVKVNGRLVKKEEYKTFKVPENSDVKVIHMVAGG